jgi:hypothetical protein
VNKVANVSNLIKEHSFIVMSHQKIAQFCTWDGVYARLSNEISARQYLDMTLPIRWL